MKMLAQQGFGPSDKILRGIENSYLTGAILSSRYTKPDKVEEKIDEWIPNGADLYIDPEFYSTHLIGTTNSKLGKLEEWDYFQKPKRGNLVTGKTVPSIIQAALEAQAVYPVSGYITPNVYIEEADSINAAIAINFIAQSTTAIQSGAVPMKPVYATLAIDRKAIRDDSHFEDLLATLTGLDDHPDGFYVLVGGGSVDGEGRHHRSDLSDPRVIANWMYLNYALSINGFSVMNGCADMFSPLLGICGAEACASGWFSGQRQFSITNYVRPANTGGQPPLIRYVSNELLSRIKQDDLDNYRPFLPEVANGLATDRPYDKEPTRTEEALQSWDALTALSTTASTGDIEADLASFEEKIDGARAAWTVLQGHGFSPGSEARFDQLTALDEGIQRFRGLAELV